MGWLITGASGYIGAHLFTEFKKQGLDPLGLDLREELFRKKFPFENNFVQADIQNQESLHQILKNRSDIEGVVHCAALKDVSESFMKPKEYASVNILGTQALLNSMVKSNIKNIIFSSSAAVYGESINSSLISETDALNPMNPYGESKQAGEELLEKFAKDHEMQVHIHRYFNVGGWADPLLADPLGSNLIPIIRRCFMEKSIFKLYGNKFRTPDGSCVRDYVAVSDVASAAVASAIFQLSNNPSTFNIFNIGSGVGTSVLQLISEFENCLDVKIEIEVCNSREGDAPLSIANVSKAENLLQWKARQSISELVRSVLTEHP